jgi:hypothetical protein
MPLYYFDVRDGEDLTSDDTGAQLATIDAAGDEATRALVEIAKDLLPGKDQRDLTIEVRGETGDHLLRASFRFEIQRLS